MWLNLHEAKVGLVEMFLRNFKKMVLHVVLWPPSLQITAWKQQFVWKFPLIPYNIMQNFKVVEQTIIEVSLFSKENGRSVDNKTALD